MEKEIIDFVVRAKLMGVTNECISNIVNDYMHSTKWIYLDAELDKIEAGAFEPWETERWENYNMKAISTIQELERELKL